MKTMQWTTIDREKERWPSGPWDGEPDKVQWQDEATGLPCIAVRHGYSWHWCGYVGVTEGHPAFQKGYDDVEVAADEDGSKYPRVHGGLTYSDFCQPHEDEASKGICHLPEPGEPDHVWWLGFDCAHSGDYGPRDAMYARDRPERCFALDWRGSYKSLQYVKNQCAELAAQLKAAQP